jgi:hypothetical protein
VELVPLWRHFSVAPCRTSGPADLERAPLGTRESAYVTATLAFLPRPQVAPVPQSPVEARHSQGKGYKSRTTGG